MRDRVRNALGPFLHLLDPAQLVGRLLLGHLVQHKATLGVVEEAEALLRLVDLNNVHEASGVEHVGADLAVDLNEALHDDHLALTVAFRPHGLCGQFGGRSPRSS
eukprot:TRINITY_DN4399_c0_g1_i1.p1 TRINITY_DN4399_c0_g1~~TRINITY_DN4399_c0_g1_i1.p1  ORF type:complete len:116 (-),score=2.54 TRINITY_DN4399_c0_g1_i1:54-368(-)